MIILDKIKQIGNMVMSIFGFRKEKSLNPASTELTHNEEQEMTRGTDVRERIIDETIKAFYTSKSKILAASGVFQEKAQTINQLFDRVYEALPTEEAKRNFQKTRNMYITGLESEMNNPLAYIPTELKSKVVNLDSRKKDNVSADDIIAKDRSYRLNVITAVLGSEAIEDPSFSSLKEQYIDAYIDLEGKNLYSYFDIDRTEPNADSAIIHEIFNTSTVARRQFIIEIGKMSCGKETEKNFVQQNYSITGNNIDPRDTYRKDDNDDHKVTNNDIIH